MKNFFKASLMATILIASSAPAFATILFSPPTITALPNQTGISVTAILTNNDLVNIVFYNADNLNLPGPFVVNDEFFTNAPLSLGPGESSGVIELFRFDVNPGAAPGLYTGTYELLGGIGTNNQFNFDPVDTASFQVEVAPEPSTFAILGSALVILGWRRHWRVGRLG
jgi:hypothetical protein